MNSSTRFWLFLVAALILVTVLAGGAGRDGPPLDPRSVNPDGTRGLVETLERLGADVELDASVPGSDATVALLIIDRLSPEDGDQLSQWVSDGGTLVVTDPASRFAPLRSGFAGADESSGDCTIPWLEEVSITADGRTFDPGNDDRCFGTRQQSFLTIDTLGAGEIVAFGGPRFLTNEELGRLDNAYIAASLLAPEPDQARVTVLAPSVVDFGDQSLDSLVAIRVRNAILMLLAAFGLYALHRMRRLGAVVREPQPVPIRGSELVLQAGVLSERAKDPASAAATIRDDFVRRWRRTLAVEHDDPARLADHLAVARPAAAATPAAILDALTRPVATDADLVEIVRTLDAVDHPPTNDVSDVGSHPVSPVSPTPSPTPDHREVSTHV